MTSEKTNTMTALQKAEQYKALFHGFQVTLHRIAADAVAQVKQKGSPKEDQPFWIEVRKLIKTI